MNRGYFKYKITQQYSAEREKKNKKVWWWLIVTKSLACEKLHQITFFLDLFLDLLEIGSLGFSSGEFRGDFGILFFTTEISGDTISDSDLLTGVTIDIGLFAEATGDDNLCDCLSTAVASFTPISSESILFP